MERWITLDLGTERDYSRLMTANRQAGEYCAQQTGPLIAHVDTISAARDIDTVRVALGAATVSLLGGSYGTALFTEYIALFPNRVRGAVLDGAVDHTRSTWQSAQDEAAATEEAFTRFSRWCSHEPSCPLFGWDIMGSYESLLERADDNDIVVRGEAVDGRLITKAVYELLCRGEWTELARGLGAAFDPTFPNREELVGPHLATDPQEAAYISIGCHDFPSDITGFADLQEKVGSLKNLAPHTWRYSEFWTWSTTCLGWPISASNPPAPQYVPNPPPVQVIDCERDPATPFQWAIALAAQFARAHLLRVDCDGHTAAPHSAPGRQQEGTFLLQPT